MNRTERFTVMLTPVILLLACTGQAEEVSHQAVTGNILIIEQPGVHGWMDFVLPAGAPHMLCTDGDCAWLLLEGGVLMQYNEPSGSWRCFDLDDAAGIRSMAAAEGRVYLLSEPALLIFDGSDLARADIPEAFTPVAIAAGKDPAVLGNDGTLAVFTEEAGFETMTPAEPVQAEPGLFRLEQDWAFASTDGVLHMVDSENGLWRSEALPFESETFLAVDGTDLFLETEGVIYRRSGPEQWEEVCSGRLFPSGLVIVSEGVVHASSPERIIAGKLSIDPVMICSNENGEPVWAMDEQGVLAWAELGSVETRLPLYEMERIQCRLAGQTGNDEIQSGEDITGIDISVSGVFRIYESVSSRPDPFTEFPATRRDLRRLLGDIAIEELHLVGITLDPAGGDQVMVEDANGVPYILYEGTELANNTHIAEITSNEVIVVQEVAVGTGSAGVEMTSIPTIYSMRLHEEGGL